MTFLEKMNRDVQVIPDRVKEIAEASYTGASKHYVSEIMKWNGKLYEVIYGIKHTMKGLWVQRLLVVPEKGPVLLRNCFWEWPGYGNPGFKSWGYDGKDWKRNYYETYEYEPCFGEADKAFPIEKVYRKLLTTEEELTALDSSLRYAHYQNGSMEPMGYIRLYRKHPRSAEMLMRFVPRMDWITDANLTQLDQEPLFFRWVERHHSELQMMAFRTAHNAYKKNPQGSARDYATSLSYRIQCGRELAFEDKELYQKILQHTSRERLCEWLSDNHIGTRVYFDYIRACDYLRLNLGDTKVLFPKNFGEMHDLYTRQYRSHEREQEKKKYEKISREMKKTADRFFFLAYSDEEYEVRLATCKSDLIDEGHDLGICVGRMDYDERQANGKIMICFIRKQSAPFTSFVCAEVKITEKTLALGQCYGAKNQVVPEVEGFCRNWMAASNKAYREKASA
ncbi:MAG: PcfJ domain-containing protein [Sphaerochaeta sp.]